MFFGAITDFFQKDLIRCRDINTIDKTLSVRSIKEQLIEKYLYTIIHICIIVAKLKLNFDMKKLKEIKKDIVPVLFTEHQFRLMEKKAANKKLTPSQKTEFSRAISKKMKAINMMLQKETDNTYIYGENRIIKTRLKKGITLLKRVSAEHKGKHIIVSGSFLHQKEYKDIDVFIITKYKKEDLKQERLHINYLQESVYNSAFFESIRKLCVSNRRIAPETLKENISSDTFISTYQELFNDLDTNSKGTISTLREFLIQSAHLSKASIPDSLELKEQTKAILQLKRPKEAVKKIFVNTIILSMKPKEAVLSMKQMINSYENIIKEYQQHKQYYLEIMGAFQEVLLIES